MAGRILIVDDEKNIRRTLEMIHQNAGWDTRTASNVDEALEILGNESFDLVYMDLAMPGRDGIEGLGEIRKRLPDQMVVILTGQGSIERAVEAVKLGAFDFLEKDCGKEKILLTSRNALERRTLARENVMLKRKVSGQREFLGRCPEVKEILAQIDKVAPTDARVLVLGESGTGKELIAQAIHDRSLRKARPFIKVNCAAIPEELIEAELFGSEKGAYTGATERRKGKFEAADGGTLFLDEVADMSLRVQTKVLRALQEGEIEKVGSSRVIKVDVRVITATNKDLPAEVAAGRVREDLYFRLNVVPIVAPPLRARRDDIPYLAQTFLDEYCEQYDMPRKRIDPEAMALLVEYPWPGNVRELKNQVERMAIMASGDVLIAGDLSVEIRGGGAVVRPKAIGTAAPVAGGVPLHEARRRFERELILSTLERNDWNVSRSADELGLERTNLHKKIKTLGLNREKGE
jgi:two-component system nitrogen regulation response regulator NtrX